MKKAKGIVPYLIVAVVLVALVAAANRPKRIEQSDFLMDTIVQIVVFDKNVRRGEEAVKEAYLEMARLESLLDRHNAASEVSQVNQAAGQKAVKVSGETMEVISRAISVGELSEGAFDITVAPLLHLWGFTTGDPRVPNEEELALALSRVDYRLIELDRAKNTVFLQENGAELDLGGIAKGFIIDKAADILFARGVASAYLDAGGDIRVIGSKPDGSAWRIGVRHPRERRQLIAVLELRDSSVVTSGDYERFFLEDGIRYHHILNPQTGLPARDLISVTVVAADAFTADALSTAVFVLGRERGMALIESLPGVEALLVTKEEEILLSGGLEGKVTLNP